MSNRIKDITGQRFGKLVAIKNTYEKVRGRYLWLFACDCGNTTSHTLYAVSCRGVKSCGCSRLDFHTARRYDLRGQRFGRLIAVEDTGVRVASGRSWLCQCDCGEQTTATVGALIAGKKKSCGCLLVDSRNDSDISGVRFGRVTAISDIGIQRRSRLWLCKCDCGETFSTTADRLKSGHTKSCGCMRVDVGKAAYSNLQESKKKEVARNAMHVEGTSLGRLTRKLPKSNTSGIRGVFFNNATKKWAAVIGFRGNNYNLGSYKTIEEAGRARKAAEELLWLPTLNQYLGINDLSDQMELKHAFRRYIQKHLNEASEAPQE